MQRGYYPQLLTSNSTLLQFFSYRERTFPQNPAVLYRTTEIRSRFLDTRVQHVSESNLLAGKTPPIIRKDMEGGGGIHQRVLKLKDVALGLKKCVPVSSHLAPASYDSAVDSLLALYNECRSASSLSKDKHVLKFINKCKVLEIQSG